MAARLTDKQKKEIIADYVEVGSYNAVAKKHGISDKTVKAVVGSDSEFTKKSEEKKEQNTADILAHMGSKKDVVNRIIDRYLDALLDEKKIASATPAQLTTALGTLIDKFTMARAAEAGKNRKDDPLTAALKEEAERMDRGNIDETKTDSGVSIHEV